MVGVEVVVVEAVRYLKQSNPNMDEKKNKNVLNINLYIIEPIYQLTKVSIMEQTFSREESATYTQDKYFRIARKDRWDTSDDATYFPNQWKAHDPPRAPYIFRYNELLKVPRGGAFKSSMKIIDEMYEEWDKTGRTKPWRRIEYW